jgi:hypothetical protein
MVRLTGIEPLDSGSIYINLDSNMA